MIRWVNKGVAMQKKISGSCLCGQVSFEVDNEFNKFNICHCQQCRKITGSAFAANLFGKPASLHWSSGEGSIARYDYPDRDFSKAFCKTCGSSVPYISNNGLAVIVPAGALHQTPLFSLVERIFYSDRAPWNDILAQAKSYERFPD